MRADVSVCIWFRDGSDVSQSVSHFQMNKLTTASKKNIYIVNKERKQTKRPSQKAEYCKETTRPTPIFSFLARALNGVGAELRRVRVEGPSRTCACRELVSCYAPWAQIRIFTPVYKIGEFSTVMAAILPECSACVRAKDPGHGLFRR